MPCVHLAYADAIVVQVWKRLRIKPGYDIGILAGAVDDIARIEEEEIVPRLADLAQICGSS